MIDLVERARAFATTAHALVDQRRRYTGEPYITHPIAVAEIVASVPHTAVMLAAALLHDVVEDTRVRIEDIEDEFGVGVAELVSWLTDVSKPSDGNRHLRKDLDLRHMALAPPDAKTIKLADLIDNSASIRTLDPKFWRSYRLEKLRLLEVLREGDPNLWAKAKSQCEVD